MEIPKFDGLLSSRGYYTLLVGAAPEKASAQDTQIATTVRTYNRAEDAGQIELYLELGRVRVRADGQPCTPTTGQPIDPISYACGAWAADSISVYFQEGSTITVISR